MSSESLRLFLLVNKSISQFYQIDGKQQPQSEGELLHLNLGNLDVCSNTITPCVPGTISNLIVTSSNPGPLPPTPYYPTYYFSVTFSWDPLPNATSYSITTNDPPGNSVVIYTPGATNATLYYNPIDPYIIITVTGITPCGNTSSTTDALPCFLAGSLVCMADKTSKVIEDIKVGDCILGAFGEINTVLALHRPCVGDALMCKINETHSTTNHHPHISADKQFYCGNPALVQTMTYGRFHKVIDASGNIVEQMLHGLKRGRVQKLHLGVQLKTVDGQRTVESLETYTLPPETQLYNLVLDGSHTYYVNGYAVTGWPREDDFDYDTWSKV